MPRPSAQRSATLIGLSAVGMWAMLGVLTATTGDVPAFLLNALTFGVSGIGGMIWLAATGRLGELRQPVAVWIVGVGGLFGFHFLYFTALELAPKVEANLVNYMWPLLIVLLSGLLPGERLRPRHVAGAVLGLAGAGLVVTRGEALAIDPAHVLGYAAAIGSAVIWAIYSVVSRRLGAVPTATVAGFCLATAILSALCHALLEETVWPAGGTAWAAVAALGVFPVGLAFFVWDHGVKRGDIQVLGAASYLSPILSTLLLIMAGHGAFGWAVGVAALLVTVGAAVASWDMIAGAGPRTKPDAGA